MMKRMETSFIFRRYIYYSVCNMDSLIQMVDVQPLGQNGTNIGFATFS